MKGIVLPHARSQSNGDGSPVYVLHIVVLCSKKGSCCNFWK